MRDGTGEGRLELVPVLLGDCTLGQHHAHVCDHVETSTGASFRGFMGKLWL